MSLFLQKRSGNIDWIIWELEESVDQLIDLLLCSTIAEQIDKMKTDKRKKEYLCSRILLKELFGECISVNYNSFGVPIIDHSDWNISITHSGKYVAVARSQSRLGIDIEQISNKLDRTKHKFSSEIELNNIDKEQSLYHLALYWSAKESVYKLVGNEPLIFDSEMIIEHFLPENEGVFILKLGSSQSKSDPNIEYRKIDNYVFTYCILEN